MKSSLVAGITLGVLLTLLTQFGFMIYQDCTRNMTEIYSKPNADARAHQKLWDYATENHLSVRDFKGPYFSDSVGLDYPTYVVCYKSTERFFCLHDYTNMISYGRWNNTDLEEPSLARWLFKEP
jgi:hypothetical protein